MQLIEDFSTKAIPDAGDMLVGVDGNTGEGFLTPVSKVIDTLEDSNWVTLYGGTPGNASIYAWRKDFRTYLYFYQCAFMSATTMIISPIIQLAAKYRPTINIEESGLYYITDGNFTPPDSGATVYPARTLFIDSTGDVYFGSPTSTGNPTKYLTLNYTKLISYPVS